MGNELWNAIDGRLKADGVVRGKKDELWVVALDVTWRPAALKSGSDPFQVKSPLFGRQWGNELGRLSIAATQIISGENHSVG